MNNEIFELSDDEVLAITGAGQIDPPSAAQAAYSEGIEVPEIENNPPG